LKEKFRRGHFWSDGKFYRSIGQVTADDTALHRQIGAHLVNGYPTRKGRVLHLIKI
jgi:hypothetical protein